MAISAPGLGSSLDVNGIVTQLMALERRPLELLQSKEVKFQSQLSAFGLLKSSLSTFQGAMSGLTLPSTFQANQATVSDASVLSVSANASAAAGSHSIEVTQLAASQKLAAAGQGSTTAAIGTGTLTFDFGTISGGSFDAGTGKYTGASFTPNGAASKTVTIDAAHSSLEGIRDAINQAAIGVSASIVNDGSGSPYRLVLSSANGGAQNSLRISVSGDAPLGALLAQDPAGTQNLAETVAARDAIVKVDGLTVTKNSNTVTDVLQGLTLTLARTNAGSPVTVSVARDAAGVKAAAESFVKAYNDLDKVLRDLTFFNPATGQAGALNGDSTVRSIQFQMRGVLSGALAGTGSDYTSLAQVGISFQSDGKLALEASRFDAALASRFEDIAALFAATGRASDSLVKFSAAGPATRPGSYDVNVTQLATRGQSVGSVAAGTTITAGVNDTLDIIVDGAAASITLAAGTYTASALAAELQARINGAGAIAAAGARVSVGQSAGVLTIVSERYGSSSGVTAAGGNGLAGLLGAPAQSAGVNVAGSIGGVAAVGAGQTLAAATGTDAEGLSIRVEGGSLGARGQVHYSQGYAHRLNDLAGQFLESDGLVEGRTEGINTSIKDLQARQDGWERRLALIEVRIRAQFTALDTLISNLSKTSEFLQQQLAALPKISQGDE